MSLRSITLILIMLVGIEVVNAQDVYPTNYRQPLDAMLVSGNFCELRKNHFHGGLDLRTGTIGKKVYSPADGYVSRIKVSKSGYGYALYITHYEGYITVYGHLNRYIKSISDFVKKKQYELKSYEIDIDLDSNIFPVKRGQIVAYTGNSGYSFGPHLHFEVRNLNDEPLNPLHFFSVKDNIKPEIKSIGIYPASDESYVNNKNTSFIFSANSSSAKNIIVHGDIYFGIEAYDGLDNVSSRNTIYSVKLLIDNKIVYYTRNDKFSYEHGRDINCLIDYKRRKTTNHRLQCTYIAPNNDLYQYIEVNNNGVFKFNDNISHKITYKVADIKGNSQQFSFYVRSSSKKLDFNSKHEYSTLFKCDDENSYSEPGIRIFMPKKTIFDDIYFQFKTFEGNKFAPMYKIHNEFVPLKDYYKISINVAKIPDNIKSKAVIMQKKFDNKYECYSGELDDNYLTISTRDFGFYYLTVDTVPPKITTVNIENNKNMRKYNSIKLLAVDMSGIAKWEGYINNKWVVVIYDKKTDAFIYKFDENTKNGNNKFELIITDKVGNSSTYSAYFSR